jgi:hypothetical protein
MTNRQHAANGLSASLNSSANCRLKHTPQLDAAKLGCAAQLILVLQIECQALRTRSFQEDAMRVDTLIR